MRNILRIILCCFATLAFGQTATVTVNTTTKVTQPPVGVLTLDGASGFKITRGTGSPEGVVTATMGSMYLDQAGAIWFKQTGTGNTGWAQLGTGGGGGGTPGGSDQMIQYNNAGAFGGVTFLTYDNSALAVKAQSGNRFIFTDPIDVTKRANLDLSIITPTNTRTVTIPDYNSSTVPGGGSAGQVLKKNSATNYDYSWGAAGGGGAPGGSNQQLQFNNSGAFGGIPYASYDGTNVTFLAQGGLTPRFTLADGIDPTKKLRFDLSNITTNNSRTLIIPDVPGSTSILGLGGATANQWVSYIGTDGIQNLAQPAFSNLSGAITTAQGGLPTGGTTNQVLSKINGTNYNTQWVTPSGGGASTLSGNTIFVDPVNGNNSTGVRGDMGKPFLTFAAAAAVATAGDLIFLRPGTYTDNSIGFEVPDNVSLVGSGRGVTTLKSSMLGTSSPFHGVLAPGNNSLIRDLSIVAVSPTGTGVEHVNAISRRTGATKSWTNVLVQNCYLYGLADCVIAGGASLGDMTFIDCTFDTPNDIFMWQSASNAILSNCELRHTTLAGSTSLGAYGIYDGGSGGTVKAYNCHYVLAGVSTTGWSTAAEAGSHVEIYDYVIDYGGQTPAATAKDLQNAGANQLFVSNVRKVNAGGAAITFNAPPNNLPPDWQQARTVANLPLSPIAGQTTTVTDGAASLAFGATVTGGGATKYEVWYDGTNWKVVGGGSVSGGGTVTSFSAGDLSPLFTTTETNVTTTPALSFTLSTAAANTVFGNATASTAAPTFSSSPRFTAIGNLTSNGFVTTTGGIGTLGVDTTAYTPTTRTLTIAGTTSDLSANRTWTLDSILANGGATLSTGLIKRTAANTLAIATAGTDYLTGNQTITLSGDVTGSGATAITTTLANIPDLVPAVGSILHTNIAAPTNPVAGKIKVYTDSTDNRLHDRNSSGVTGTTVVADTGATNNFLTAISAAGAISKAQPAFSNLSGTATVAQLPVMIASGASHAAGIAPDPGVTAGTTKFLREDATWAVPAGGGNVSNVGTPTNGQIAQWTSATTIQGLATTGSGNAVLATSPTITTPTIAALANLTSNGFVKTGGGIGTLSVDTNTYLTSATGVTTFASGNLSPLFTVTPSAATSGAITQAFTLSNAAGNTVFGNTSSTGAAPAFAQLVNGQLPATLSGHTIDNTNSATFKDGSNFTLQNTTTATKQATFDLSNITAANTRTINIPDANSTTAQAKTSTTSQWLNSMSAQGVFTSTQPAFTDISGTIGAGQVATTTDLQFKDLGLNVAAPTSGGQISTVLGANNITGLTIKRNTDTSPTGNFETFNNAAGTALWNVDITGSLTTGTVPAARLSGTLAAAQFPALTGDVTTTAGSLATAISNNAVVTNDINNNAVTYAKMQAASATSKLIGSSASATALGEITLGTNLSMTGSTLNASGAGTPGGSTTQIQYNNAGAFGGISSFTFDGTIPGTVTLTPAANTFATGLFLTDTTASTSANQQYSPSVILRGQGWHTGGTAGNQTVDFRITNVPFQSTLATSEANLNFDLSLAGGAYVTQMTLATGNANAATPQIVMPQGSAGTPCYSFAGDVSSGWYRAAASDIRLSISGSDQVQFLSGINATWMATRKLSFGNTIASPNATLALDSSFNGFNILTGATAGNWGLLKVGTFDGSTSAVTNGLTIGHRGTAAGAAGMGSAVLFNVDDTTTADVNAAQIASAWSTATHSSNVSYLDFLLVNGSTTLGSKMRLFGSGGLSVNNTTDPGAGVISANSGYWVGTAASTSGKILKSDGTKFIASTETYAAPGTSGNVMKSDGTNWTSGTVTAAPGGSDTQIQFNDAGAFNGNTNFTITKGTNTMTAWGMKFVQGPLSSGGWIDMPTTGPSGIGTGGAGTNPWVAYVASATQWFPGTATGDLAYRNAAGQRTFFGIGTSNATFNLGASQTMDFASGSILGWSSATDSNAAIDSGFARNAAGVIEVNSGTAAAYRDMKMRTLLLNPGAAPTGVEGALYGNSTDHKIYYYNGTSFVDLTAGGAGGTPGGSNTQVQFNDSGSFNGDAGLTYDKTNDFATITGSPSAGNTQAGFVLQNTQTATSTNQFPSPWVQFTGHGWDTNTLADKTEDWRIYNLAASGYGGYQTLAFDMRYAGGAWTNVVQMIYGATIGKGIIINADGLGNQPALQFASNAAGFWNSSKGVTAMKSNVSLITFGNPIQTSSDNFYAWTSTSSDSTATVDTALSRDSAGIVQVNNGTAGTYRPLKAAGATFVQTASQAGNAVSTQTTVTSTVDQTATAETAHVTYTVPANSVNAGTMFRITASGDMDNGTTAITFTPRLRWGGTAGTQLLATPTVVGTTTALTGKTWKAEAVVTIRTTGATGTAMAELALSNHTSVTSGAYAQDEANSGGTAVTIDTTANKDLVLSWTLSATTGTPHVRTYQAAIELLKQ